MATLKYLVHYLNPMVHIGEKKYPVLFPIITTISVYILSEIFGYLIWKNPNGMGTPDVVITLLLVLYFSFRGGKKGGIIVSLLSTIFFIYFIFSRTTSLSIKETAYITAGILTIIYFFIAFVIGWLKETIDDLLAKEVSARINAEASERKFRSLADNIPILCWMAHPDGSIFWYNKRWYQYTGKTEKQTAGWGWEKIHDPEMLPKVLKSWNESIQKGSPFEMIFPLKGVNGKYRQFLTRVVPVRDEKKKIIYWFGTNTDVTEQKEIEQRKDDFIAMVSHELKTPLTSIKVFAQLLQRNPQKEESLNLLNKLNDSVDNLNNLVLSILDVSRIEQGKTKVQRERFLIRNLVSDIIDNLQPITKHQLLIDWHTKLYVYADKERIRQVLTNLITNAIKYSPKADKVIIHSEKKDTFIQISVQDFGIGIPQTEQKKVFDRFYQSSSHKTYPGLGLGLYISSEIVHANGGKMWVKSEEGKGATFYFTLPIQK